MVQVYGTLNLKCGQWQLAGCWPGQRLGGMEKNQRVSYAGDFKPWGAEAPGGAGGSLQSPGTLSSMLSSSGWEAWHGEAKAPHTGDVKSYIN